ncbi:MAG: hypothetical protein K6F51_03590 [Acetatifactor sp.]|nr:hypothetical protein [Acetatifactor sp.]
MSREDAKKIADILKELDQRAARALLQKNHDEALMIYHEILKAQQDLGLEKLSGHTLLNMANVSMMKGDFTKALSMIEQAATLKSIQKDEKDRGNVEIFRANNMFLTNHAEEAEHILLRELKRNKNHTACGQMELLLFGYYRRGQKNAKARSIVDKAISHFKLDHNKEDLIRAYRCRADHFMELGQKLYAELDLAEIEKLEERGA